MELGVSAFAWTGKFELRHLPLLSKVRDLGFSTLEIPMFKPSDLPVPSLRSALQQQDLACTICGILPPGINPICQDVTIRRRSADHLSACVETAAEIGATVLAGPLFAPIGYLPGHRTTQDEVEWAVEAFQALAPLLDSTGITLALEPVNRSETFFLRTVFEARTLVEHIGHPRIGITIDTFHANIEEKSIPAAVASLGPYLRHMHLSENDRGPLGTGHVDFTAVLAALQAVAYQGSLIIEGFGFDPAEPEAPGALWADPAVSPAALAEEGLRYLRNLLAAQS